MLQSRCASMCEKTRPYRDSIPRPPGPQRFARRTKQFMSTVNLVNSHDSEFAYPKKRNTKLVILPSVLLVSVQSSGRRSVSKQITTEKPMSQFSMKRRVEFLRISRQFPLQFFCGTMRRMLDYLKMDKEATVVLLFYNGNVFFSLLNSQTVTFVNKQHVSWTIVSYSLLQSPIVSYSLLIRTVTDSLQFINFENNFLLADVFTSNDFC